MTCHYGSFTRAHRKVRDIRQGTILRTLPEPNGARAFCPGPYAFIGRTTLPRRLPATSEHAANGNYSGSTYLPGARVPQAQAGPRWVTRKPRLSSCTLCPVPLVPLARPRRPGGDGRKVLAGAVSQTTGNGVKGPVHL